MLLSVLKQYIAFTLVSTSPTGSAYDLLKKYPGLISKTKDRGSILEVLANKPLAFQSGSRFGYWRRLIYNRQLLFTIFGYILEFLKYNSIQKHIAQCSLTSYGGFHRDSSARKTHSLP